jgi:hypothetical protein
MENSGICCANTRASLANSSAAGQRPTLRCCSAAASRACPALQFARLQRAQQMSSLPCYAPPLPPPPNFPPHRGGGAGLFINGNM